MWRPGHETTPRTGVAPDLQCSVQNSMPHDLQSYNMLCYLCRIRTSDLLCYVSMLRPLTPGFFLAVAAGLALGMNSALRGESGTSGALQEVGGARGTAAVGLCKESVSEGIAHI